MDTADLLVQIWRVVDDKGLQMARDRWLEVMRDVAGEFAGAPASEKAELRERMDFAWARLFRGWARRAAELAVNMSSQELLPLGLALASFNRGGDSRDSLALVPLYRRAAERLDLSERRMFDAAMELTDAEGAKWLGSLRGTRWRPEDMGFVEIEDERGFRFEQV